MNIDNVGLKNSSYIESLDNTSRDGLNILHAAWTDVRYFGLQDIENSGSIHSNCSFYYLK